MDIKKVAKTIKGYLIACSIPIVAFLICKLVAPGTITLKVIPTNIGQAIGTAILAYGVVCKSKAGLWDMSLGANVIVTSIFAGHIVNAIGQPLGVSIFVLLISCIIIGMIIGTITGLLYIKLHVPSIILTVGVMLMLESVTQLTFDAKGVTVDKAILVLGRFPYNYLLLLLAAVILYFIYSKSSYGYKVRAVEQNLAIAKQNGVNIDKTMLGTFIISGLYCGMYAFFTFGKSYRVQPASGMSSMGTVFSAIICAFIARALEDKVNIVFGIFIGALVSRIITIFVMVLRLNTTFGDVFTGLLLIGLLAIENNKETIARFKQRVFHRKPALTVK